MTWNMDVPNDGNKIFTITSHFYSNFTIIFTYILLLGDKNSPDMSDDIKWEIITISIYLSTAIIALDFAPPPNTILNFLHHLFTVWNGGSIFYPNLHTVWKNWDRYVQSISKKSVFVLITSKIGQVYMKTYKFKGKVTVKCQFSVLGKSANNRGYVDISSRKLTWKEGAFCSATNFCHIQKKSIECRRNNI